MLPFGAPPKFDIESLLAIAEARQSIYRYHVWLLQTDPSYMQRFLGILSEYEFSQKASIKAKLLSAAVEVMHSGITFRAWDSLVSPPKSRQC